MEFTIKIDPIHCKIDGVFKRWIFVCYNKNKQKCFQGLAANKHVTSQNNRPSTRK
jgi:hypothetical protein